MITLMTATRGRHGCMRRLLSMMLAQDAPAGSMRWLILNNQPEPLEIADQPNWIEVVNVGADVLPTLGHCRNKLLSMVDTPFCRIIDDDDLYAPWDIRTGVERIGAAVAWKPARSWWCDGTGKGSGQSRRPGTFELAANSMEASITWRTEFVRSIGFYDGQGDESRALLAAISGPATDELGYWSPYCYCHGVTHNASATIGNGKTAEDNAAAWTAHNVDMSREPLTPDSAGVMAWWRMLCRALPDDLQTPWMRAICKIGQPMSNPGSPSRSSIKGRIVAAPGCWDALHDGHIATLQWARQQGDCLVAIVNDDSGVAAQKGADRPLVPLGGRISALLNLECVDDIMIAAGVSDMPALKELSPHVVVKGSDYAGKEKAIAVPDGIQLLIAPHSGVSLHTSRLI